MRRIAFALLCILTASCTNPFWLQDLAGGVLDLATSIGMLVLLATVVLAVAVAWSRLRRWLNRKD